MSQSPEYNFPVHTSNSQLQNSQSDNMSDDNSQSQNNNNQNNNANLNSNPNGDNGEPHDNQNQNDNENENENENDNAFKLFVGQIPPFTSEEMLNSTFTQFGPISQIVLLKDRITGAHKGKLWKH